MRMIEDGPNTHVAHCLPFAAGGIWVRNWHRNKCLRIMNMTCSFRKQIGYYFNVIIMKICWCPMWRHFVQVNRGLPVRPHIGYPLLLAMSWVPVCDIQFSLITFMEFSVGYFSLMEFCKHFRHLSSSFKVHWTTAIKSSLILYILLYKVFDSFNNYWGRIERIMIGNYILSGKRPHSGIIFVAYKCSIWEHSMCHKWIFDTLNNIGDRWKEIMEAVQTKKPNKRTNLRTLLIVHKTHKGGNVKLKE